MSVLIHVLIIYQLKITLFINKLNCEDLQILQIAKDRYSAGIMYHISCAAVLGCKKLLI